MKRIISIVAAVALSGAMVFAQPAGGRGEAGKGSKCPDKKVMERVYAEKVAFLTKELDLSVEEAQAFWPVYNKVQNEQMESAKQVREAFREMNKAVEEGKPESEIKTLIDNYTSSLAACKKDDAANVKAYLKVLPASKVAKLLSAEEKFRKQHVGHAGGPGRGPQGDGAKGQQGGKDKKGHKGAPERPQGNEI